ncbi:MAG: hypothetical protein K2O35_01750 [Clostridia bacterium]|nr:hypothetical protein [Clostridia bacterium]
MASLLIFTGIFLLLCGALRLKKFQLYGLLTALIFTVMSIELLADIDGLTLGVLTALTLISAMSINIKIYDMISCVVLILPCVFWLSTQEFVDGFAHSHILVALGAAIACNLLFDRQKRQTLCALVLLTSFAVCNLSDAYFNAIDISFAFFVGIALSDGFYSRPVEDYRQDNIKLSRQTL